ncbi:MAG: hypothetical protein FWD18_06510 [Micrococcales bacterium]|nr:hypothetical protein [Micrococcales bacterium]
MSRPRLLAVIAVWLVVVAGTSTLVWAVISSVSEPPTSPTSPGLPPVATPTEVRPPVSSPSPSGQDGEERRTWQGQGGVVVAVCDGDEVHLVSAQPVAGFRVKVEDHGPVRLKVEFEGHGHGAREVKVYTRCVEGVPVFTTQTEGR